MSSPLLPRPGGKPSGARVAVRTLRSLPALESLEAREVPVAWSFDFGPAGAPVAPGSVGVGADVYTSSLGYGWRSITGVNWLMATTNAA